MSIQFACIHAYIIYNVIPLDIESVVVVGDILESEAIMLELADAVDEQCELLHWDYSGRVHIEW